MGCPLHAAWQRCRECVWSVCSGVQGMPIERMSEVWASHWLWGRAGRHMHVERPSLDPDGELLANRKA